MLLGPEQRRYLMLRGMPNADLFAKYESTLHIFKR